MSSIFVTESGDWRLAELGFLTQIPFEFSNGNATTNMPGVIPLKQFYNLLPSQYKPPELVSQRWNVVEERPYGIDSWGFACLLHEVFQGSFEKSMDLQECSKLPTSLQQVYKRLLSKAPEQRVTISKVLKSKYFETPFVETQEFLENMSMKDSADINTFLEKITKNLPEFPVNSCKYRILPCLLNALKYNGIAKAIVPIFEIGKLINNENEYRDLFIPEIVELFSGGQIGNDDIIVKLNLLRNLPKIVPYLESSVVQEKLYPNIAKGFNSQVASVREETVKAMIELVPKLKQDTIEGDVVKAMWILQSDPQPAIRTNTVIAFGRLAQTFSEKTRSELIAVALTRSLRDPFVHSRLASLKAIQATKDCFSIFDLTEKILPRICCVLVDSEKGVREAALACCYSIMQDASNIIASDQFKSKTELQNKDDLIESKSNGYLSWMAGKLISGKIINNLNNENDIITANSNQRQIPEKSVYTPPLQQQQQMEAKTTFEKNVQNHMNSKVFHSKDDDDDDTGSSNWGDITSDPAVDESESNLASKNTLEDANNDWVKESLWNDDHELKKKQNKNNVDLKKSKPLKLVLNVEPSSSLSYHHGVNMNNSNQMKGKTSMSTGTSKKQTLQGDLLEELDKLNLEQFHGNKNPPSSDGWASVEEDIFEIAKMKSTANTSSSSSALLKSHQKFNKK